MSKGQKTGFILGPVLFTLILLFAPTSADGLTDVGKKVLACMIWMICWWSFQPVSLGQTALLPIILFPILGLNSSVNISSTSGYVNSAVLLTVSIFWIGAAIEKWNLHRRIAFTILNAVGTKPLAILLAFAGVSGAISMWMSNTACTAMMIPIVTALTLSVSEFDKTYARKLGTALMLVVAYEATNGGTATPIGNNANITGLGIITELSGSEIDFPTFMLFAVPICTMTVIVSTIIIYYSMGLHKTKVNLDRSVISTELHKLGEMQQGEKNVFIILVLAILCWLTKTLWSSYLPFVSDYMIGGLAAAALFLLPSAKGQNEPTLDFKYALSHTSWDCVFLIGGSLVIGSAFASSGLTDWIADLMSGISTMPEAAAIVIMAVIAAAVTEFGSNIIAAAVFIPIANSIALAGGHDTMLAMVNIIFACSFAYMLPQGCPQNALAIGSGLVENQQMLKTGTLVKIVLLILYPFMLFGLKTIGFIRI